MESVMQALSAIGPWLGVFLGGSLFGSVVMALLNVRIDTFKSRRSRRLALIEKARSDLFRGPEGSGHWNDFDFYCYLQTTDAWNALLPHLNCEYLARVRKIKEQFGTKEFDYDYLSELKMEVGRLEKKWKLI